MLKLHDLKIAFNSLGKARGYVVIIVITLGVTMGALVAMFNLNYQLLVASLPYPNADRLVLFKSQQYVKGRQAASRFAPYPALVELYQHKNQHFEQKALIKYTDSIERRMPDSPVLNTISTTPEYFEILKMPMELGRYLSNEEGLGTYIPVTVISYKTWQKLFHGDPDILNKTINIMEVDFKIIGVTAKNYVEPSIFQTGWIADVWLPFDYDDMPKTLRKEWRTSISTGFVIGLLKPEANFLDAEYEDSSFINARFKEELKTFSALADNVLELHLTNLKSFILRDASQSILLMLAGALGLLVLASANIINLILSRMASHQRSFAIQVGLGAQPKHIFNNVLAEILLLLCGAVCLAIVIASLLLELLKNMALKQLPRIHELHVNYSSFFFIITVAIILAISFSIFVSKQLNHRELNSLLHSSGKGVAFQISSKARRLLILSQVAITGVLLVISMQILIDSWRELIRAPGLETKDQYQVELSNAVLFSTNTDAERRAYSNSIIEALRDYPKVEFASAMDSPPISPDGNIYRFVMHTLDDQDPVPAVMSRADKQFFNIVKMPLIEGRIYNDDEVRENASLLVVNETLAKLFQTNGSVVGMRIYRHGEPEPSQIVGVVKDLQLSGSEDVPRYFWSRRSEWPGILLKMKAGQTLDVIELNQICAKINPRIKAFYLKTTEQILAEYLAPKKIAGIAAAALALLTLSFAAIGIYGVLSYSIHLRRFELGTRMAIGARPTTIFLQILKDNAMPVIAGLLAAFVVLIGLWLWIQTTHYDLHTTSLGWLLPPVLILSLTVGTSLLSVWHIIRKPANNILRGD